MQWPISVRRLGLPGVSRRKKCCAISFELYISHTTAANGLEHHLVSGCCTEPVRVHDGAADTAGATGISLPDRLPRGEHVPAQHPRDREEVSHQVDEDGLRPAGVALAEGFH